MLDYDREFARGRKEGLGFDSDAAQDVASHYNRLEDRHRTLEAGSDILRVRNLHNWIKSVLIGKHMQRGWSVLDLACQR